MEYRSLDNLNVVNFAPAVQDNMQMLFDRAYIGIMKQGKPGMYEGTCCILNPIDRTRCAVGMMLPIEELLGVDVISEKLMERYNVSSIFLDSVMAAHDNATRCEKAPWRAEAPYDLFLAIFKNKMQDVAERFNLRVPEVA